MDEFEEMHDHQGAALAFLQTFSPQDLAQPAPAEPLFVPSETGEDVPAPTKPKYTEDQLKLMPEWVETSKKMFEVMNDGQRFIGSDKQAASYGLDLMSEFNWNMAGPAGIPGESGISVPGFGVQVYNLMSESAGPDAANGFLNMLDIYADTKTEGATIKRAFRGLAADPLTYATPVGSLYSLGAKAMARKTATTGLRNMLMSTAKAAGYVGEKAVVAPGKTGMAAGAGYGMGFEGGLMGVETAADDQPTLAEAATRLAVSGTVGSAVGGTFGKVLVGGATEAAPAIARGVDQAGQAAEARMAERGPITDRVMSGADPMEVIDPALAAAGKLVRPTKENPVTAVAPTETEPGIIAFHGSGADFDQFSLEKIGTGEGAQAYGYGLYFTDSEDIAKFYKDAVANQENLYLQLDGKPIDSVYTQDNIDAHSDFLEKNFEPDEYDDALTVLDNLGQGLNNIDDADSMAESSLNLNQYSIYEKIRDYLKEPELMQGKIYKVGLEPNPDDMLNYQTTFADQPKKVQDALKAIGYEVEKNRVGQKKPKSQIDLAMRRPMPMILDSLKGRIIEDIKAGEQDPGRADKILSEKLLEQGIPGIKYRAAGSRGASIDAADVKMNYVIFDDKAIKILEKYGIVGPVAITALGAAKQEGADNGDT